MGSPLGRSRCARQSLPELAMPIVDSCIRARFRTAARRRATPTTAGTGDALDPFPRLHQHDTARGCPQQDHPPVDHRKGARIPVWPRPFASHDNRHARCTHRSVQLPAPAARLRFRCRRNQNQVPAAACTRSRKAPPASSAALPSVRNCVTTSRRILAGK
jgi:hypothetical protein